MMPRPYHSPSSVSTGERCEMRWWLEYREGRRPPQPKWPEVEHDPKAKGRAAALGVAVHEVFEAYYAGKASGLAHTLPGQIALAGMPHLPHPTRCEDGAVERPIGSDPIDFHGETPPDHAPRVGFTWSGVTWAGFRDLLARPTADESRRLGVAPGWMLVDYKSKGDLAWALTAEQLAADFQANLYALASCVELGLDRITARWLNIRTKRPHHALPRDVVLHADHSNLIVEARAVVARRLDSLTRAEDARANTAACGDYGGCPHHKSVGGPCHARRSPGAIIQARIRPKEIRKMALSESARLKFAAKTAAPALTVVEDQAPPPAEMVEPDIEAADTAPAHVEAKRGRGRPKKPAPVAVDPHNMAATQAEIVADVTGLGVAATFDFPGEHGKLTLTGHPFDILTALSALMHAAS